MFKKVICVLIICAIFVSISPAVVAVSTPEKPTIEEILSEYHQAAFQEQNADKQTAGSTYSPRSNSKTLEQETVDTLNAAGYEAYNITSTNYEALELQINADFDDMGLDRDSSYIVIISGEYSNNSNTASNITPRAIVPAPDPGGGGPFTYTYNGTTYTMRYITVTAAQESNLKKDFSYSFNKNQFSENWATIHEAIISYCVDSASRVPIASILSLMTTLANDGNFRILDSDQLTILGTTNWTLRYVQIYDEGKSQWISSQVSEYANSQCRCAGYLYNAATNTSQFYSGHETAFKTYSELYRNLAQCRIDAVVAYTHSNGAIQRDETGDIDFYITNPSGDVNYCGNGQVFFTQPHWSMY